MGETDQTYDTIIVGGGPAGCALAARLADTRPGQTVALIEAGPAKSGLLSDVPIGIAFLLPRKSARNSAYTTVPQPGLGGRRGYQPRGRGLGGSSLINGMVYTRGHPTDYDDWEDAGCPGWGFRDVLPYFKRSEHNERGGDDFHGTGGPLNVADLRDPNPLSSAFVQAGVEAGYHATSDFNGAEQEGFGLYQTYQKHGQRWNVARAYLGDRQRPNLHVLTDAQVQRIVFDGRRAAGVAVRRDDAMQTLHARAEIVLAAGAFGSPQLLMASGVGPAAHLKQHGIAVVHDSPEVGSNLQDHLDYVIVRKVSNRLLIGTTPGWMVQVMPDILRWKRERRGPVTSNLAEAGAFIKSDPALPRPDLQLHFVIGIADDHGRKLHLARGLSVHVCVLRPKSRGTVRLASADTADMPLIDPGYFSAVADLDALAEGVRITRRVMAAPSFARLGGRDLHGRGDEDGEALRDMIRARADTIYHPVGTCRMGGDAGAVLDPELRVRGLDGLRVADASIMPTLVGGNTQAASAMIGEKCADLMTRANT